MLRTGGCCVQARHRPRCCSVGNRKQQLVAVRIVDLEHVVAPPRREIRNRSLDKFTTQFCKGGRRQLDEQTSPVSACGVLAENDLAFTATDLADLARATAFMPTLLEAEHVDVELKRAAHIGDEKNWARVPPVSSLAWHGSFPHCQRQSLRPGSTNCLNRPTVAALVINMTSRRFEHDVLRAMIQHVAPHLLESFSAFYDLEKMISCKLTDLASED